ncbi:MAG: UDP-N-acetylmuramoyl-L-alanyl-D-glutamate--2,6-diaminopimelate ligase [Phaeodactylibacter sp.]|nr:UDP-N-acetylmuramoyl-L-alanyl-D-glutamate--2,6-diaminopimelate ligase [Phaeodactylibacter sp.]
MTNILERLIVEAVDGPADRTVAAIRFDSRAVRQDDLFVAVRGTQTDGHQYIDKAIEKGATTIVAEQLPAEKPEGLTFVRVHNSAQALGQLAAAFFDYPSEKLEVVAITGTNGKTTTVSLLHDLVSRLGYKVGLLSTVENRIAQEVVPATHTTPDAVQLQHLLAQMVEAGCAYVFMEASSHAIDQGRMAGLQLRGAIFSNLSHDHLDYHKTFQDYIYAKKRLFDELPADAFALVNIDDKRGMVMVQNTQAKVITYALKRPADFKAKILENTLAGLHLDLAGSDFYGRLIGVFNAYNLLAAYAVTQLLQLDKMEVLQVLSNLVPAPGRFETVRLEQRDITGIVDYAHTPDAVEKVLMTIDQLRAGKGRTLTVVGCGGDRDKGKRPIMAKTACNLSNLVILTSDNPRTEDPEAILDDMEAGVPIDAKHKQLRITNRREAIKTACVMAQPGDVILVAGKGHEKYQEINGQRYPFDDLTELKTGLGLPTPSKTELT